MLLIILLKLNEEVVRGSKLGNSRSKRFANDACGVPSQTTSLIIRGDDFQRGAWPWLVALLQKAVSPPKLFCGAVLVSPKKVITGEFAVSKEKLKLTVKHSGL